MNLQARYTIMRKIADGGTAEIFLAKQKGAQGFEKMVVLKRIFTNFYADPQFRHMLVDEAHIAMSLYHSNIVQVLDLGESDGRYFLALELVDGWTLDQVLRRAKQAHVPFPPALALYVTAEVGRALSYAHGKSRDGKPLGIVHRDISPHNVLLSEQGEVKLTDFGIAKAQNKKEQSLGNLIKGKIAYMSPEQASGTELDARSDLFSLGTMLYVMITGRQPFDAPTDFETLMLVKSGDFIPPETARPGLNPDLYRVIRKAMARSPSDRYQKADDMLMDVEQVMRLGFRAVGQTELVRWLGDLAEKDGIPPLTRAAAKANEAVPTLGAATAGAETESGVVLDVDDADLISGPRPPAFAPRPSADPSSTPSLSMRLAGLGWWSDRTRRRKVIGVGVAVAALVVVLVAIKSIAASNAAREAERQRVAVIAESAARAEAARKAAAAAEEEQRKERERQAAAEEAARRAASEADAAATQEAVTGETATADGGAGLPQEPTEGEPEGETETASEGSKRAGKKQISVLIKSDPEGSKVTSRHRAFGSTPVAVRLKPGTIYELTFAKPGYATTSKRYRATSERSQSIKVTLKKLPEAAAGKKAPATETAPKASATDDKDPKKWWKFSR
jgi:tRNA A-37 threonylcarbamoyl transferase component Bud32